MSLSPTPFKVSFSDEQLAKLKSQLQAAHVAAPTFESSGAGGKYGVQGDWMKDMKEYWEDGFDWRAQEARMNQAPQFTALLPQPAPSPPFKMHFVHSRSSSPNARPLLLLHGWPGSFLEFLEVVKILEKSGDFHCVSPSMPGYAFSDAPPLDREFGLEEVARLMNELMLGLGYSEYAVQGGDWGSLVARILAVSYSSVKAAHLNLFFTGPPPPSLLHTYAPALGRWTLPSFVGVALQKAFLEPIYGAAGASEIGLEEHEKEGLRRKAAFLASGTGYLGEHASKPSTIAAVVSSSPVALLGWVGEKFQAWTDVNPTKDELLTNLTLWWLTDTYATSIYPYRHLGTGRPQDPKWYINKPTGFSSFAKEIAPTPRRWAAQSCDLVFYRYHDKGGHFAAMEQPELLAQDVREFLETVWPMAGKGQV